MRSFREHLLACARDEGFPLAGTIDVEPVVAGARFRAMTGEYDARLRRGLGAGLDYLVRGAEKRRDPRLIFPAAKSVLCLAVPYESLGVGLAGKVRMNPAAGPWFSRYLDGPDYHVAMTAKIEKLMVRVQAGWSSPIKWKSCVDFGAVLEKGWAVLCGLGWVGDDAPRSKVPGR